MTEVAALQAELTARVNECDKLRGAVESEILQKRHRNDILRQQLADLRKEEFKSKQSLNLLNHDLRYETEQGRGLLDSYVDMSTKTAKVHAEIEYRKETSKTSTEFYRSLESVG
jgi:iron-sulfur cluster repair protein YtfE (RIC family)